MLAGLAELRPHRLDDTVRVRPVDRLRRRPLEDLDHRPVLRAHCVHRAVRGKPFATKDRNVLADELDQARFEPGARFVGDDHGLPTWNSPQDGF
jgi:hypothetical protein